MARLWTDEQEAAFRAMPRPGGRWSGGVYVPAEVEEPSVVRRPGFLREVVRALKDLRHE
ncbi:MAG: hypothetical protein HY084_12920 [Gemmatimonadetes bacterium]|nr:hypothetical protein [Gemmatimonadota bacterium]